MVSDSSGESSNSSGEWSTSDDDFVREDIEAMVPSEAVLHARFWDHMTRNSMPAAGTFDSDLQARLRNIANFVGLQHDYLEEDWTLNEVNEGRAFTVYEAMYSARLRRVAKDLRAHFRAQMATARQLRARQLLRRALASPHTALGRHRLRLESRNLPAPPSPRPRPQPRRRSRSRSPRAHSPVRGRFARGNRSPHPYSSSIRIPTHFTRRRR